MNENNIFGESQNKNTKNSDYTENIDSFWFNKKRLIIIVLGAIIIALFIVFILFYVKYKINNQANKPAIINQNAIDQKINAGTLPSNQLNTNDINYSEEEINNIRAETLSFNQFYEKINEEININYNKLELPIQVKTDVSNYYDVSRKIDFSDLNLAEINKNGFTITSNQLSGKNDNFYGAYIALIDQGIPQLVTSDFLIYYYQNMLKEVFADIKSNTFFNDLWMINKNFFDIADSRYKTTASKIGLANDPVLEGQRLEAAYFATALELLRCKPDQINNSNNIDENKFTSKEAADYNFTLPDYLNDDVKKEVELIYRAKEEIKSPVFRYQQKYAIYRVPDDLANNDKLKNFYLANRWANSIFPLYHRDTKCPECLLDKNDWLINLVANSYIAKDFSDNQDLKNRWARVYKVLSFFSGLRKDLTYLQFNEVLANLYGNDYAINDVFSAEQGLDNALAAAVKIQSEIEKKYSFSAIEGGYNRSMTINKPHIGMRLLQEDYWPDDFILKQLVTPNVGNYNGKYDILTGNNITARKLTSQKLMERVKAIGLDIINLYSPVLNNGYFNENTSYENYSLQSRKLADQLKNFTADSWHNSNYWSIMYLNQHFLLEQIGQPGPINTTSGAWQQKNINTAMSAWVNLKLPSDKLNINVAKNDKLATSKETEVFVEPNLALINELLANTKMLSQMLNALKIINNVDTALKKLNEFSDDLSIIKFLAIKEMQGEDLEIDSDSRLAIQNILKKYIITTNQLKNVTIDFGKYATTESINGVKLQAVVYQQKNDKILVVGPIFNYTEK